MSKFHKLHKGWREGGSGAGGVGRATCGKWIWVWLDHYIRLLKTFSKTYMTKQKPNTQPLQSPTYDLTGAPPQPSPNPDSNHSPAAHSPDSTRLQRHAPRGLLVGWSSQRRGGDGWRFVVGLGFGRCLVEGCRWSRKRGWLWWR